jgi:N6-adenosine-specific RNA methylase IME4
VLGIARLSGIFILGGFEMNDIILNKIDQARNLLMQCTNANDAKKVKDIAFAAKIYAQRRNLGQESINYAHEIMIEADKLLGDFLRTTQKNTGTRSQLKGKDSSGDSIVELPENNIPKLSDIGISLKESMKSQYISNLSENNPQKYEEIKTNKKTINEVKREIKREENRKIVEEHKKNPIIPKINELPDLILADPPWKYDFQQENRKIENQYNTASVEEIFTHKPNTKDNAILFLWATAPKLLEALQVMKEWGFIYRTHAVWDKVNIGMGFWFRGVHELLLVGIKGKPGSTPESECVASIFREKRGKHSVKPECVYEWIERAFPSFIKLEMYCRKPRKNWQSWGAEIE